MRNFWPLCDWMSLLPVYVHPAFSRNVAENSECETFDHRATEWTFDHCTAKGRCKDINDTSPHNTRPVVRGITRQVFWNHFNPTKVKRSGSELSVMMRLNIIVISIGIWIWSHQDWKFQIETFHRGATISLRNFRPVVRGVTHQDFWNYFSRTTVKSSEFQLRTYNHGVTKS